MAIRDLGYRPYDGERHEAGKNTLVLLRHSIKRAWRSWIVKLALLFSWVPLAGFAIATFIAQRIDSDVTSGTMVYALMQTQWLTFGFLLTLSAGAGAIGYDLNHGAFPYFFSKPVLPMQYLVGRIGAVLLLVFFVTFVPGILLVAFVIMLSPAEQLASNALLVVPVLAGATLISVTLAACSVGISALSKSRALTSSAWIIVFLIPWGLASVVEGTAGWPWLRLAAVPSLLTTVLAALFEQTEANDVFHWYYALPALVVIIAGCGAITIRKVKHVEVIA